MTIPACLLIVLGIWWAEPKLIAFGALLSVIGLAMMYTKENDHGN